MNQMVYLPRHNISLNLAQISAVEWNYIPEELEGQGCTTTIHLCGGHGFFVGSSDARILSKALQTYNERLQRSLAILPELPSILEQLGLLLGALAAPSVNNSSEVGFRTTNANVNATSVSGNGNAGDGTITNKTGRERVSQTTQK